jgi:predicted dehydrogenase
MSFRIGIIGAGNITQSALIKAIDLTDELHLAAVVDPDPNALNAVARLSPYTVCTTSEDEFFATPLDAIHVATPNNLHELYACKALSLGLPTLVEKPLAESISAGRRMLEAEGQARCIAMIGYMSKYNSANRYAKKLLDSGAIGHIRAMTALSHGWSERSWRNRRSDAGLGSLGDLAIYPVLTAADIFGTEAVSCHATVWPNGHSKDNDMYAEGTVWFDGERHLHLESSFTYRRTSAWISDYTVIGDDGILRVKGSWRMDGGGRIEVLNSGGRKVVVPKPTDQYAEQYRMLAACSGGASVPSCVTLERGLRDLAILHAMDHSSASGGILINVGAVLAGG